MRILASGSFGEFLRASLETTHSMTCQHDADTLLLGDAYDSAALCDAAASTPSGRIATCFLTTRGVFVSCWLTKNGPCSSCFDHRWLANLRFWEHTPDTERTLQKLERASPGLRSFAIPKSVVPLAKAAVGAVLDETIDSGLCTYVDLVSCRTVFGMLYPLSNCPCQMLAPARPPGGRYTRDLAAKLRPPALLRNL